MQSTKDRVAILTTENPFMSKTDIVCHVIREDILSERLKGGTKLNQEVLASELNLSRSPIREALHRLEGEGFLEKSTPGGYRVYDIRLADYIAINEFRSMLEINAARIAARHISDKDVKILGEIISATEQAVKEGDAATFMELDEKFHMALIHAANNPFLIETYERYLKRFHLFRIRTVTRDILTTALRWHHKIHRAVLNGDVESAVDSTRMHRETTVNSLLTLDKID